MKKASIAVMLAVVSMMTVSSCSASPVEDNKQSASTASPTTTTSAPSAVASPSGNPKAGDVINGLPTKSELADNGKGKYIQTTILDSDPAMQYDQKVDRPEVTQLFNPDEVAEAQKFVIRFVAEEAIDSTINDNYADMAVVNAWWEKNKDKIDPNYSDMLHQSLMNSKDMTLALVQRAHFRTYGLANGSDKTHVLTRKISLGSISGVTQNGINYLAFTGTADYTLATDVGTPEPTQAAFQLSVTKNPATGKWVISGFKNTFSTTPVK